MWLLLLIQSFGFNTAANMNEGGVSWTKKLIATNISAFGEINPAGNLFWISTGYYLGAICHQQPARLHG